MQQPAQVSQYIVLPSSFYFALYGMPELASKAIDSRRLCPTPNVAIEVFLTTFSSTVMPNVTDNYVVVEVTRRDGRNILNKFSDLTAAHINKVLWDRYVNPDQYKLQPQVMQQLVKQINQSPSNVYHAPRGNPSPEQVAQLLAQVVREAAKLPQARGNPLSPSPAAPPVPAAAASSSSANPPPQPAAASPSPAQRMSPFWGKPAAEAAAAPAPQRDVLHDRSDDRRVKVDLTAMKRFIGMTNEQLHDSTASKYFAKLQLVLPNDFFQLDVNGKFNWIMNNRGNGSLYPALKSNPPLACLFLDKLVAGNPQHRSALKSTRFGMLYEITDILDQRGFQQRYGHLDNAVQILKAEQILERMIENQRLQMLQRQAERERQRVPLVVPEVKEGQRTQLIHDLHIQNKLSRAIDDDLCDMFTGRLFKDPVKLTQMINGESHKFHFERSQILLWHSSKQKPDGTALNPYNNVPFRTQELQDAPEMVARVEAFKKSVDADLAANVPADAHSSSASASSLTPNHPHHK